MKTAAAAGVKPAALLTRIGPHDRPVPKPAFELTQKKLDPKTPAAGTRKAVVKTKRKKPTATAKATAAKPTAGAKKAAAPGKEKSVAPKRAPGSGGQKPSPAIARSQTSEARTQ
jgi:hypothetical protein